MTALLSSGFSKSRNAAILRGLVASAFMALTVSGAANAGTALRLRSGVAVLPQKAEEALQSMRARLSDGLSVEKRSVSRVLQLSRVWTEADSEALRAQGVDLVRYLPDDAWIVRGSEERILSSALALDSTSKVGELAPEWKVAPEVLALDEKPITLWLQLYPRADLVRAEAALRAVGGGSVRGAGRDWYVDTTPGRLSALASVDGVEWIQEAPILVTMDFSPNADEPAPSDSPRVPPALTGYESGTRIMGFEAAWSRGFQGEGQIVAVADTGVDSGDRATLHPDLQPAFVSGKAIGLGGSSWKDPMGHGTHVAGSVVSRGTASNGAITGGAKGAGLVALGMWSDILNNLAPPYDVDGLVAPAYSAGARIHTNSWGNPRAMGEYDSLASRVDEWLWNHPEMTILFAAGNSGEDTNQDGRIDPGSVTSPATAKNCVTIGASENLLAEGGIQKKLSELRDGAKKWGVGPMKDDKVSDNPNGMAMFSSRGPTLDGRLKPDVVAPGTNIVSTRSRVPGASALWGEYDASYAYSGGTSMATPLAAGAAAVVRQALVKAKNIASPSGALVKATLIHTSVDLFPGQYGTAQYQEFETRRPNIHEGYGRVDVDAGTSLEKATVVDEVAGVAGGAVWAMPVHLGGRVRAGSTLRATLAYTDAPGSPSAAATLVNDLDLELIDSTGKLVASKADHVNNVEMLELKDLPAGDYKLQVRGVRVAQGKNGKQPFALVVSR